ncbi:hypothetical protein [Nonomuraea soli]|uniref:WD40 repeat domain-containing protein n=1 Tax=Nonomuraea soli TaxID=1032476 RepID=A0A7W0CFP7_9ACTN|nr:hypothetical protein [Nonomuraea soli]MBA2890353.1 hypothetical protein [Nonomuraea soli]
MNIEELVRETLADLAREQQPPPPARFLAGARREGRRWRRVWRPLAAAAAVIVAVAATVAVLRWSRDLPQPPAQREVAGSGEPAPVERLWPDAVHELPLKLPGQTVYRPELFLDAGRLLIRTGKGDSADPPVWWSYDVESGSHRRLVTFEPPAATDHTSAVVMGGGHLAWFTVSYGSIKGRLDLWAVPVTGGTPRKVASIRQSMKYGDIDALEIVGDRIVWSRGIAGGVYTAPVSGGSPRLVEGGRSLHLLRWPWATAPPRRAGDRVEPRPIFRRLVNLETGEERGSPSDAITCSLSWCTTMRGVRARDGGPLLLWPGDLGLRHRLTADRLVTVSRNGQAYLWDVRTRALADLGARYPLTRNDKSLGNYTEPFHSVTDLLIYDRAGKRIVIHLPAIR